MIPVGEEVVVQLPEARPFVGRVVAHPANGCLLVQRDRRETAIQIPPEFASRIAEMTTEQEQKLAAADQLQALGAGPMEPSKDALEWIKLDSSEVIEVKFSSEELLASCPVTGQRDIYHFEISLRSSGSTIESKSLKLFLGSYDGDTIFAEDLANDIADRIYASHREQVGDDTKFGFALLLRQNVRGGITTEVKAKRV